MKKRLVIVGAGMASGKFCEELVAREVNFEITVIGKGKWGNYDRTKLLYLLKEQHVENFFLNPPEWYKENNINFIPNTELVDIDRNKRVVYLSNEKFLKYEILVIATGSYPFIPPIKGLDLPGIFAIRTIEDVEKLKNSLNGKLNIMVIGGGLLGIELACFIRNMGKNVIVSHLMPTIMEMQLCDEDGKILQKKIERKGLKFVTGNYITEFFGSTGGVEEAIFKDGQRVKIDLAIFSCGIKPNADLAKKAGLNYNKGIVVDEHLTTNDPNIFAIGECIEFKGQVFGLVSQVYEQSKFLATYLQKRDKSLKYNPSPLPPTRLKSEIPVISMGRIHNLPEDEIVVFVDDYNLIFKKLIIRDNRIVGANFVGDDLNIDVISILYSTGAYLPENRSEILFPGSKASEQIFDAKDWPDDLQICDCNGVNVLEIRKSIRKGNDTLYKVMNTTRAGTGCGNCKNKIKALLISEVGELKEDPTEKYFLPGIPMARDELTNLILKNNIKSVSDVLSKIPEAKDDAKTRMGLDFLLSYIWKGNYIIENDSKHPNDRYSANIQKDGRYSIIPAVYGGVIDPENLIKIASVAKKHNAIIKITGSDRIGLYSVEKKDLPNVWKELDMPCGFAYTKSFRACKTCVGNDYCRFGLGNSIGLGKKISKRYSGIMNPAKVKMGISGCPRNCSEATIKDIGVVAIESGWEVYIGGNGGARVFVGKKLETVKTETEVIDLIDSFLEYYRKNANYLERVSYFVERTGINKIREEVLRDLFEKKIFKTELEKTVKNQIDPWKKQFSIFKEINAQKSDNEKYYKALKLDDLKKRDRILLKIFDDKELAIFRIDNGEIIVTDAKCPHENGPIIEAIIGDGKICCPLHLYSFDIKTGVSTNEKIKQLKIYQTKIFDGDLYIKIE